VTYVHDAHHLSSLVQRLGDDLSVAVSSEGGLQRRDGVVEHGLVGPLLCTDGIADAALLLVLDFEAFQTFQAFFGRLDVHLSPVGLLLQRPDAGVLEHAGETVREAAAHRLVLGIDGAADSEVGGRRLRVIFANKKRTNKTVGLVGRVNATRPHEGSTEQEMVAVGLTLKVALLEVS